MLLCQLSPSPCWKGGRPRQGRAAPRACMCLSLLLLLALLDKPMRNDGEAVAELLGALPFFPFPPQGGRGGGSGTPSAMPRAHICCTVDGADDAERCSRAKRALAETPFSASFCEDGRSLACEAPQRGLFFFWHSRHSAFTYAGVHVGNCRAHPAGSERVVLIRDAQQSKPATASSGDGPPRDQRGGP